MTTQSMHQQWEERLDEILDAFKTYIVSHYDAVDGSAEKLNGEATKQAINAAVLELVVGEDLGEADGWDHWFSEEAKCCPGDDFAYFGNRIKDEQRKRAAKYLPPSNTKNGEEV